MASAARALPAAAPAALARRPAVAPPPPPLFARPLCRRRRSCFTTAAAGSGRPLERFDDLSGPSPAFTTFDDLLRDQLRAMERAQSEVVDLQRAMDRRFTDAQRELEQAAASGSGRAQQGGPCGYRWQRSTERTGAGGRYQEWRSESFTVIGVDPQRCGMMQAHAPPTAAALGGPWATLGLLLAAALAGFWAAATAAFNRGFGLTTFRDSSRWRLLLLWPLLLLVSSEFRQQFVAAVRGRRAQPPPPPPPPSGGGGQPGVSGA